jgi:hypothetical protein
MPADEPPDHRTRFKKGQSGNPKGRPRGSKNQTMLLRDVLFKTIRVKDNQTVRTLPKIFVAAEVCLNNAIKGDLRSFVKIMELAQKFEIFKPGSDLSDEITCIRRIIVDPEKSEKDSEISRIEYIIVDPKEPVPPSEVN